MIAMRKDHDNDREEPTPQVISDIIGLVAKPVIPPAVIATWTQAERDEALSWAGGEHLSASDNRGVRRVPQPLFVARTLQVLESEAMAQVAVDSWITCKEMVRTPGMVSDAAESAVAGAQMAITGLIALLGDEHRRYGPGPVPWQVTAMFYMGRYPGGTRTVDLVAALGGECPPAETLREWLVQGEDDEWLEEIYPDTWRLRKK